MTRKYVSMLAALLLVACGNNDGASGPTPAADQPTATESTAANDLPAGTEEPEIEAAPTATSSAARADGGTSPTSARFQLGTHYNRLSPTQPTSSSPEQIEVAEIFWYGCPHCFAFDPYVKAWVAKKPEYVSFVRVPAVWNPLLRLHARAFYTAEALGKGAEMHDPLFREIHENHNMLDTEDQLRDFFGKFGVDAAAFKGAFDSFAVHAKLQRADELNRRYRVQSVPAVVVNGKYTTDGSMAGGYDELFALVDELAAAEHANK
jgi:protein dithiol oxidoreductase (disulfide-forming)